MNHAFIMEILNSLCHLFDNIGGGLFIELLIRHLVLYGIEVPISRIFDYQVNVFFVIEIAI